MNGADSAEAEPETSSESDSEVLSSRQHVCEILCFCVHKHSYRIKYFILRNNVLVKVLKLATHQDKCLVLAALRFFRACIGLRDEFYNRYVVKNKCFEEVMTQLLANRHKDNMLHSVILELFEFIRRENIKSLIAHLAETYEAQLASLKHVDIFKGLLLRYEQNEEYKGLTPGNASSGCAPLATTGVPQPAAGYHNVRRAFPDDDDDEAYFNESDEEEDAAVLPAVEEPPQTIADSVPLHPFPSTADGMAEPQLRIPQLPRQTHQANHGDVIQNSFRRDTTSLSGLSAGFGEAAPWEHPVRPRNEDDGKFKRQRLEPRNDDDGKFKGQRLEQPSRVSSAPHGS